MNKMDNSIDVCLDEQACIVYFLCNKDPRDDWNRLLSDDMVSASTEHVLLLWQKLVQLQDNQLVTVLFQYKDSKDAIKTKVLLFTTENDGLLVCNGLGSDSLLFVSCDTMIDLLDWWSNLPDANVPQQAHPMYSKVFCCDTNVTTIHLFTETHDISSNTNLRLAQFNRLCVLAQHQSSPQSAVLHFVAPEQF